MAELAVRGRSREMGRAREALRRAAGQGRGCVLSVTGDPGIGKTTLLEAIRAHALSMGFAVGFAKVDEVSAITPGAPVLLALRSRSRPLLDDAAFRSLAALYDKTLWLVDRIADLLETRAQHGPILIVLDDMQWADPLSRLAVRILASRLSDSPVVWAVSARDEPGQMLVDLDTAEAFNGVTVDHVELGPLADADVIAIATDILGAPPAAAAAGGLRRAGGNPLLAVQYSEGVALDRARGRDSDTIPTSLATALRARTRSLGPDAMRILQLAAVWGRPLELATAAQMLGSVSPGLLLDSAAEAVASGLLERPGNPIAFRHDLVREFVYEGTTESERAALHELCASCLVQNGHGPLEAAPHARLGARRGDRKAIGILREAAAACGMAMPQTAADLMQDAFEGLAEADPLRPEVGEEYAGFLAQAQRGADVIAVVDALLSQPHSAEFDARLQALAARALWLMGLPDDMARRTGNALAHSGISKPLRSRLKASRALAFNRVGPPETALAAAEAALAEGDMLGDRATLVLAREALGEIARNEGRHLAAYEHCHELRTLVGASYLAEEIAALQFIDRFDEADALLMEASRSAGEGLAADLPSLVCAQLWQDFKLGRFDEAVADARTLLRVTNEIGNHVHRLDAHVVTSTIAVVHGNLGLARELLAKAEDEEAADDPVQVPGLVLARARIAAADGDSGAGLRLLKPLMSSSSPASRAHWPRLLDQMRLHAGIAVGAGDMAFARETAHHAMSAAQRNPGVASFRGVALQVRGFVYGEAAPLGSAVELLRGSPRPVMLASALTDHGVALVRSGSRSQGIRQLEEAWSIYDGLDAQPAMTGVQQELDAAGARRKRPAGDKRRPDFGWAALTDSEVRVARLVSAGHTNRSVAELLGVTTSTIGTHLRSIFAKMDVQSRVQLANAVRGGGPGAESPRRYGRGPA
jgi:DNA-binding CsgD family transcriptional regulator/tetratricopeptide (TPR) repeat protein